MSPSPHRFACPRCGVVFEVGGRERSTTVFYKAENWMRQCRWKFAGSPFLCPESLLSPDAGSRETSSSNQARKGLSKSDVWNGLVNRFLWVAVRCSMFVSSQRHRRFAVPPIDASLLPL
jgi:hypothetical protein